MAKTKGPKKMTGTKSDVKSIRLELEEPMHREFRIEAAKEGQSMSALAKRLVEEWIIRRRGTKK
jgi:hypothetical protein